MLPGARVLRLVLGLSVNAAPSASGGRWRGCRRFSGGDNLKWSAADVPPRLRSRDSRGPGRSGLRRAPLRPQSQAVCVAQDPVRICNARRPAFCYNLRRGRMGAHRGVACLLRGGALQEVICRHDVGHLVDIAALRHAIGVVCPHIRRRWVGSLRHGQAQDEDDA